MRRSIRSKILVPILVVQVGAVAASAVASAVVAARRVESEVAARLDAMADTLRRAGFPLTPGVLATMRGLTGAHFVAFDRAGGPPRASTLAAVDRVPAGIAAAPPSARVGFGDDRYFAATVPASADHDRPNLLVLYPEADWRRARWAAALPPLLVGLASIVPMAGATAFVAFRIGERIGRVGERVASIASGNFQVASQNVPDDADEVADLVRSVEQMAAQLVGLRATIRRAERSGLLAQLAAGLAHQLRNAATGARMAVQIHARRCPGRSDGLDDSLDVALRQLALCEDQVKGLLSAGDPRKPTRSGSTPVDPSSLVDEVARLVGPAARHARVSLEARPGPGATPFEGDAESTRAAVLNLALNAVEAAGAGGSVLIASGPVGTGPGVWFEVSDDGPGPPASIAPTMFEPFVTSKAEGVGLGLAMARRVAADHGGELTWTRRAGRTRFRLTIEIAPAAGPLEGLAP